MEDDLNFFLKNQNEDLKKKEDYLKKKEDDLQTKWKMTSKRNGRQPQKKKNGQTQAKLKKININCL